MTVERQREYETVYIIRPDVEEGAKTDVKEKIEEVVEEHGGELHDFDDWGSRELAYEIDADTEGVTYSRGDYQCYSYRVPGEAVQEIERQLRLFDTIIKFMTIKLDDDIPVDQAS